MINARRSASYLCIEAATKAGWGTTAAPRRRGMFLSYDFVVDIDKAEVEMPEWQDWLIGIPVLIALLVILLVEVTDR